MKLIMTDKRTRVEPESLDTLMRISYNYLQLVTITSVNWGSQRRYSCLEDQQKPSYLFWRIVNLVGRVMLKLTNWNLRQFSFAFIYFIERGFTSFFIDNNEKVMSRQYHGIILVIIIHFENIAFCTNFFSFLFFFQKEISEILFSDGFFIKFLQR